MIFGYCLRIPVIVGELTYSSVLYFVWYEIMYTLVEHRQYVISFAEMDNIWREVGDPNAVDEEDFTFGTSPRTNDGHGDGHTVVGRKLRSEVGVENLRVPTTTAKSIPTGQVIDSKNSAAAPQPTQRNPTFKSLW